jgi:hypothetical protein
LASGQLITRAEMDKIHRFGPNNSQPSWSNIASHQDRNAQNA